MAAYPALAAEHVPLAFAAVGALALVIFVVGVLWWPPAVLVALVVAAGGYVGWLEADGRGLDAAAPFVAAALALAAELAYRSLEARGPVPPARGENARRALDALAVAAAGLGAGLLVLAVGDASPGGGGVFEVVGVAAAIAALALVALLSAVDSPRGPGSRR